MQSMWTKPATKLCAETVGSLGYMSQLMSLAIEGGTVTVVGGTYNSTLLTG